MSVADNPNNEKAGNAGSGKALLKVIEGVKRCPRSLVGGMRYNLLQVDGGGAAISCFFLHSAAMSAPCLACWHIFVVLRSACLVAASLVSHLIAVEWLDSKCWLAMVCCGASSGDGLAFH
ncbi:hypothetical protein U1Q18_040831 [Sarracenia purpurea var. burkii]